MAPNHFDIVYTTVSVLGFLCVALGFSTRYWFFSENSRWQFKCDLGTCCVRDIAPWPVNWTCWPIKDPPKLFKLGVVFTACGLALWLPSVVCFLAARAKLYPRHTCRLGLCFLMVAGGLGVFGCKLLFETAQEEFIIAEVPGISGYLVRAGFYLTLAGATLASRRTIFYFVDRVLLLVGSVLGCVTAVLWVLLRAILTRAAPVTASLRRLQAKFLPALRTAGAVTKARLVSVAVRLKACAVRLKAWLFWLGTVVKKSFRPVAELARPRLVRTCACVQPRLLHVCALGVLVTSAVLTFLETKVVAKMAAVLIVCSPRLYALLTSLRSLLRDRALLQATAKDLAYRAYHVVRTYLERLVRPSFECTLRFIMTRAVKQHRTVLSKAMALNGVSIHPI